MAKKSTSNLKSQTTERGIASAVSRSISSALGPVMDKFADAADKMASAANNVEQAAKNAGKEEKKKKLTPTEKKLAQGQSDLNDMFGAKNMKGWSNILGKKGADAFLKSFSGVKNKKGPAGDVLKSGMGLASKFGSVTGSLAKFGGGMVKFGGQIIAAYQAVSAFADAIEEVRGKLYETGTALSVMFDNKTAMSADPNSASFKRDKGLYLDTKEGRQKKANWNFVQPLLQRQAMERDMFDLQKQSETDLLTYQQSLVTDEYNFRKDKEADWMNFSQQQAVQTFEANAARTKTLFTLNMSNMRKSIGISERALQAIGSSTEAVMDAVKNVGVTLGTTLKNQVSMATSAAGLGAMFGATSDEVLTMSKTFRLMDKSTARQALNMVAGVAAFAKMNDMSPAQLHKEMADSQEEIFKYTNYTSMEYAKQIVQLKSMNTSMTSMMKASDAMVLNYKDSIQAEMSLGAMLGQNVDLSETRALLMSGKTSEAASAMKSALGGIDIGAMNPFAKQQLSQATGMDIGELMNMMSGKETKSKGQLEAENAAKTGAAIANGALRQDISNEATKLAMEQDMRAKMLKFEQDKRLDMLAIEQLQRLDGIALEAKWRIKTAKLENDQDIDRAVQEMRATTAASNMANLFGNFTGEFKTLLPAKATAQQMQDATASFGKSQSDLAKLVAAGYVSGSDKRILDYRDAAGKAAAKGGQLNAEDFFGGTQVLAKKKADELAKKEADLKKSLAIQEKNKMEGVGTWAERNLPFYRMFVGSATGDADWQGKKDKLQAKENNIASTKDALAEVQRQKAAELKKAAGTGGGGSLTNDGFKGIQDTSTKAITDTASTISKNQLTVDSKTQSEAGIRGIIHQKEFEFGNKIANEQIAQQATTNALLQAILTSTETGKTINLDGIKVNKTLLNSNRASYGLAK
jgi:hypothetical protein